MSSVFANGRSIVQKGDGLTNVSGPPDVCKTPSPGGPVPIPYVNVAQDSDLSSGSKKVKIEGNSAALESSNLSTSTGDEPGTAGGGLLSSKTKGKLSWGSSSTDVKFEGKGVVRFGDVTQHNGNTFNTVLAQLGSASTGFIYGDDADLCPLCEKDPSQHKHVEETDDTKAKANQLAEALKSKSLFVRSGRDTPDAGYMVAVVQCGCHPNTQVYAHSGKIAVIGFEGAVTGGNWIYAGERVHEGNIKNFAFRKKATTPEQKQAAARQRQKVKSMFEAANEKHQESKRGKTEESFNSPGLCAAPKAINKAHELGIDLKFMTEQFVASTAGARMEGQVKYSITGKDRELIATSTQTFGDGDTVPSCGTCKIIVMAMLCSEEETPCKAT